MNDKPLPRRVACINTAEPFRRMPLFCSKYRSVSHTVSRRYAEKNGSAYPFEDTSLSFIGLLSDYVIEKRDNFSLPRDASGARKGAELFNSIRLPMNVICNEYLKVLALRADSSRSASAER